MGSLCKLTSQTTTRMFRILLIASFCLLLQQVNADNTCCLGGDSCDHTCETDNMCLTITTGGVSARSCDVGGVQCKKAGCSDVGGIGMVEHCCCNGDKCNLQYGSGGNLQYGSVLMTLIMAVISRFI